MLHELLNKIVEYGYMPLKLIEYFQLKVNENAYNEDEKQFYNKVINQLQSNNKIDFDSNAKSIFKYGIIIAVLEILSTDKISMDTYKLLLTFGVNPVTLQSLIKTYIEDSEIFIRKENKYPNVKQLNEFLESIYSIFKDSYKDSLDIVGLQYLISD